jgi:hypothetical protein
MSRQVELRPNYRNDSGFLLRLETAVLKDNRETPEWRKETAGLIHVVAQRFLEADGRRPDEPARRRAVTASK